MTDPCPERAAARPALPAGRAPSRFSPPHLLAVVTAMLVFNLAVQIAKSLVSPDNFCDFSIYYTSARALDEGIDIYRLPNEAIEGLRSRYGVPEASVGPPQYSPTVFALVAPFARLPFRLAARAWLLCNAAILVICAALTARLFRSTGGGDGPCSGLIFASLAFATSQPLLEDLAVGQINLPILCCVLAGFLLLPGRSSLAGICLGVAASIKVYYGLLLVPLLLRGERRAAGMFAATFAACAAAGILFVPTEIVLSYYGRLVEGFGALARHPGNPTFSSVFIGLPHLIRRVLHGAPHATSALSLAASVGLVLFTFLRARRTGGTDLADFAATLCVLMIVSPTTQEHYLVLTLPVLVVAWNAAGTAGERSILGVAWILIHGRYGIMQLGAGLTGWPVLLIFTKLYGLILLWHLVLRRRPAG